MDIKKRILLVLLLSGIYFAGFGQDSTPDNERKVCVADELLQKSIEENSWLSGFLRQVEESVQNWIRQYPFNPQLHRSPITIPVVVHVVYYSAAENISDAQINSQISALNTIFKTLDTARVRRDAPQFRNYAADNMYFQFKLAKRKPDGTATTGITRDSTTRDRFIYNSVLQSEEVKRSTHGAAAWDPKKYLNIWVCDLWLDLGAGPRDGLLGYATFPGDTSQIQGVAMDYKAFGTLGTATAPYNLGVTTAHEVGHFLDLFHTFQGGCNDQDHVAETPAQSSPNWGCPGAAHRDTCAGTNGIVMHMNYMDYSNDNCRYMFTTGQRMRALAHFKPGGLRSGLAVSNALLPPNVTTINHQVFLEAQNQQLPSWKAALVMIHAWACQCTPDVNAMVRDHAGQAGRHITGIPNDISEVIHALALTPEEINMSYSASGFYGLLQDGPIALLSADTNESYGLVINGMSIDPTTGEARLSIKDPMSVGPRGFFMVNQTGSEYTVSYSDFMINILDRMARNNRKVYIVYPPSATSAVRFP